MLKTRDPLGPHSLALAEAFLAPLHNAGFSNRDTGLCPLPPPPTASAAHPSEAHPMGAFLCADSHRVRYRLAPDL